MADITLTSSEVSVVRNDPDDQYTLVAGVVLGRGVHVKEDATTGKWAKAADTDIGTVQTYITIGEAIAAGEAVTAISKGLIDLGPDALAELDYGVAVWASATAGLLADASVGAAKKVGFVKPATAENPYGKILAVDL